MTDENTRTRYELYSVTEDAKTLYKALDDSVDPETGEVTPEYYNICMAIESLEGALEERVTTACNVYLEEKSELKRIEEALKRLETLKDRQQKLVNKLKTAIDMCCISFGLERIDTPLLKMSYRESESVEIDNAAEIPDEYWRVKKEANKTAIKAAIKAGKTVGGVHLEQKKSIQIK